LLLFPVPEDEDLDAMLRVTIAWDADWNKYVDVQTGELKRPAGTFPIEMDLVQDLAFYPGFDVGPMLLCWQHLNKVPCQDWTKRRRDEYAEYLLGRLDIVHSKHCRQELYSSSSSDYCKYFLFSSNMVPFY
jgi:hypothetical protein